MARIALREALRIASARREQPLPEETELLHLVQFDPGTDHIEERVDMRCAMASLSKLEREALLLHYWADMTHDQIATALDAPLGTIKLRVFRGRKKLERAFAEHVAAER